MDLQLATVYRFTYPAGLQPVSPERMWGTLEAIATLPGCEPLMDERRDVLTIKLDRHGFYFELYDDPRSLDPLTYAATPARAAA